LKQNEGVLRELMPENNEWIKTTDKTYRESQVWRCASSPSGAHHWVEVEDYGESSLFRCKYCGEERKIPPDQGIEPPTAKVVNSSSPKDEEAKMKNTAIYCRVSTEDQEREGTSLQSQKEACLKKAQELGYEVSEDLTITETYSGLSLDRPKLTELRQQARDGVIDTIIVHTPDRLSRVGEDVLLLVKEFKVNSVNLLFVKEQWDDTLNGKVVAFILGWASEVEADHIRERTMRGKRTRAERGRLPSGTGRKLYGYDYLAGKGIGEGIRYENKEEARWVKEMYKWLVEERLTVNGITRRLRALGVPTPAGGAFWRRQSVFRMLTNPAYTGKTYAFTRDYIEPKRRRNPDARRKKTGILLKPKDQWLEIPNATPPIIAEELFEAAQEQLKRNRELSPRNSKREYLLSGYVFCSQCKRRYQGYVKKWKGNGKRYEQRYYRCGGSQSIVTPITCNNWGWHAPTLEEKVWQEIETKLSKPDTVLKALEIQANEAKQKEPLQSRLEQVEAQLENRQKQKERIWRAFELTGDEGTFKQDIERLAREIASLENEKLELGHKIQSYQQYEINAERIKEACHLFSTNLKGLTYEGKRFALDALQIKVWLDNEKVTVEGAIPITDRNIVSSASR